MGINFKKTVLRYTPINHKGLIEAGFNVDKLFYRLADLSIYVEKKKFYYLDPGAKKTYITNMLQVSKLVYGGTDYLR